MATDNRKTCYAITVYPESTDCELFLAYLRTLHIPIAVSPLHDRDVYTEIDAIEWDNRNDGKNGGVLDENEVGNRPVPGTPKKPHYHVVFDFGKQKKSAAFVISLVAEFVPYVRYAEPIGNKFGYTKYLCHLDETDKPHYDVDDCVSICGYDLSPLYSVTKGQKREMLKTMVGWCWDYGIYDYSELVDVVFLVNDPGMIETVQENAYFITRYVEGVKMRQTKPQPTAISVGEVARAIVLTLGGGVDELTGEVKG